MRAKELEVTDKTAIGAIIKKASICRLAVTEDNIPYVVPLCFGYDGDSIYFHSGPRGKKLEILKKNPNVCFLIDLDHKLVTADAACDFEFKYRSVIGFGKASFVEDAASKCRVLDLIVSNYSKQSMQLPAEAVADTAVIKVDIESMTGRVYGY